MMLEVVCTLLNIAIGALGMYVWMKLISPRLASRRPDPQASKKALISVAVFLALGGSVFVGVQSYHTDQTVRDLHLKTQECYREFSEALNARAKIAAEDNELLKENDALSRKQRDALARSQTALYKLIATMISPEAVAMAPEARRELNLRATREFNTVLSDSNRIVAEASAQELANDQERQRHDEERKLHPLPQPDCGLE